MADDALLAVAKRHAQVALGARFREHSVFRKQIPNGALIATGLAGAHRQTGRTGQIVFEIRSEGSVMPKRQRTGALVRYMLGNECGPDTEPIGEPLQQRTEVRRSDVARRAVDDGVEQLIGALP